MVEGILLILSFILNVDYFLLVNSNYSNGPFKLLNVVMNFVRVGIVFVMFIGEVFLCFCFVKPFAKQSHSVDSTLKSHQNNVNFIIIGIVIIDSVTLIAYGLYETSFSTIVLFFVLQKSEDCERGEQIFKEETEFGWCRWYQNFG